MSEPLPFATEETYLHATDCGVAEAERTMLVIEIADEAYGIATDAVREIIRVVEITEVPRTPRFVLGVVSIRGAIVPIVDLRARLGFAPSTLTRAARIVIVAHGTQRFGLVVDGVLGLERFRERAIEATPAIFGAGRLGIDRFLASVGRIDGRIVAFLELATILAFDA